MVLEFVKKCILSEASGSDARPAAISQHAPSRCDALSVAVHLVQHEVSDDRDAQKDAVPPKGLEIVLADKVHEEADGQQ